ncbi:MAG: ribonuclease Z [Ardenticatenaceae bacterium]|nr:ribonuclease Z [Ardenticatenaceae bacterium]HBY93594.1 ribonuclease Z [Chloroflexota bacterium]
MFEVVFLGTSASAPSAQRNVSATMVLYREYRFLIDAGEGTQRQLLKSGLGFRKLEHVLITHGHLDHILGLAGIVSTLARWEVGERLTIYAGRAPIHRVRDLILGVVLRGQRPPPWIDFVELNPGIVLEDDKFELGAFRVKHRGPDSFGFLFQEKPRRPFQPEKAEVLGVPFGPERSLLVAGQAITLPNGRIVHPDEVLGPAEAGTKLVYVGDVDEVAPLVEIAGGADALIIEATYAEGEAAMAAEHGHITARRAAWLAREAGVKRLYLNHISRRYRGPEIEAEARELFPEAVVVKDFDQIQVKR